MDDVLPLFGDSAGESRVDTAFSTASRVHLDEHSWVEHVPGWFSGADALFRELLDGQSWQQRRRWMYGERVNLYRHHRDSTGWHGDGASTRRLESVVPVLSLGAPRRFLVRPKDGGASRTFRPVAGDLVVMGGRCQQDWRHSVPKEAMPTGARISVNFAASSQARPDAAARRDR